MLYLSEAEIAQVLTPEMAADAIEHAFIAWANNEAAVQPRVRTVTRAGKLSSLGAILTDSGLAGAKIYPTSEDGRFGFIVLLFDLKAAEPLAVMDGSALTEIRTAATSVMVARQLARPASRILTIFGSGRQALSHARAFSLEFRLDEIRLVTSRSNLPGVEGLRAVATSVVNDPVKALRECDLIVTATRSVEPLFGGELIPPGCHVTAVGATTASSRELDTKSIDRSEVIVVESIEQARIEAGDLVIPAGEGKAVWDRVVELADLVAGRSTGRLRDDQITLYESLGIGLEDVAVAAVAYRDAVERGLGTALGTVEPLWVD
jgi:ornithine cyclodeaminase